MQRSSRQLSTASEFGAIEQSSFPVPPLAMQPVSIWTLTLAEAPGRAVLSSPSAPVREQVSWKVCAVCALADIESPYGIVITWAVSSAG